MSKHRGWIITANIDTEAKDGGEQEITEYYNTICVDSLPEPVRYICGQLEEGENGNLHYQLFVYLHHPRTLVSARSLFNHPRWSWHSVGSNPAFKHVPVGKQNCNAMQYCTKEATRIDGPYERGEPPSQGRRSDLEGVARAVQEGRSLADVARSDPSTYVKFYRGLEHLERILNPPKPLPKKVWCLWGSTGVGKTHRILDARPEAYYSTTTNLQWFDGYMGQRSIVIDEFNFSEVTVEDFLVFTDRIPRLLPIKGGFVTSRIEEIFITTNIAPYDWTWKRGATASQTEAVNRRITAIEVKDREQVIEFD